MRRLTPLAAAKSCDAAGALLAEVFLDDPVVRYYFEGVRDRARAVRAMMTAAVALTLRFGSAYQLHWRGELSGVALLLPPERRDFPSAASLRAVLRRPRLWNLRGLRRYFGVAGSVDRHRPRSPCWTLVSLGILPAHQGQGRGSWMLEEVLTRLPRGAPVFLETYQPRNLPFYGARGFEVADEFLTDDGNGPRAWTMIRPPASL